MWYSDWMILGAGVQTGTFVLIGCFQAGVQTGAFVLIGCFQARVQNWYICSDWVFSSRSTKLVHLF
jgi:hypothetical protein